MATLEAVECAGCAGTGYVCMNCLEPDGQCACGEDGPDIEPCWTCNGRGLEPRQESPE